MLFNIFLVIFILVVSLPLIMLIGVLVQSIGQILLAIMRGLYAFPFMVARDLRAVVAVLRRQK